MKRIALLMVPALMGIGAADGPRLHGFSLGIGDWINVTEGDWDTREEYGTLPGFSVYGSGWGWQAGLELPVKSAFKKIRHEIRFSLGDAELSVGKRMGAWTPRVVLQAPMYDWSADDALTNELFIGSGNVNLGLGTGAKAPRAWLPAKWELAADLEASVAVTRGLADIGSSRMSGVAQAGNSLGSRSKAGANLLLLFNYWRWIPDYWDQEGETRFIIMPGAFFDVRLFRSTYVGFKAGIGVYDYRALVRPRYVPRPQRPYTLGLSVYQGL